MLEERDYEKIAQIFAKEMQPMKQDISGLKEDVSGLKEDVNVLKEDVSGLKEDVNVLKEDVSGLKEDVSGLKEKVGVLDQNMGSMTKRVDRLQRDMQDGFTSIELTLENETNRNIRIVAENHADLNRKLSEALVVEREKELFLIRFNSLEDKVRRMQQAMG